MRRPSRSPNSHKTPWVWSHGDGRGHFTGPKIAHAESNCHAEITRQLKIMNSPFKGYMGVPLTCSLPG
eukprot:1176417-Pyramimonas_sp.AAC.1